MELPVILLLASHLILFGMNVVNFDSNIVERLHSSRVLTIWIALCRLLCGRLYGYVPYYEQVLLPNLASDCT